MANSLAKATPIPALAPVISAHFPDQFAAVSGVACDKVPSTKDVFRYFPWRRTASLFLGDRKAVNQTPALVLDAVHQTARPNKFSGQQTKPEKNHEHSRPSSYQHNATSQKQGESSNDEEDPAELLDRAERHRPLRKRLSRRTGEILTHRNG